MLSNSKIIHSSGKVRIDSIDENGIMILKSTYTHKFKKLKELLKIKINLNFLKLLNHEK